jgi:hypothetical protein
MKRPPTGAGRRHACSTAPVIPGLALLILLLPGCGSSGGTKEDTPPTTTDFSRYVRENESTFNPSDYGIETWDSGAAAGRTIIPVESTDPVTDLVRDTVPGFRVQVMITQEIDRATSLRDSLFAAMPGQWIYLVYHPPYYKVRIGNYTDRFDADATLARLRKAGLTDAWVVPDRIVRNPPPAPLPRDSTDGPGDPFPRR